MSFLGTLPAQPDFGKFGALVKQISADQQKKAQLSTAASALGKKSHAGLPSQQPGQPGQPAAQPGAQPAVGASPLAHAIATPNGQPAAGAHPAAGPLTPAQALAQLQTQQTQLQTQLGGDQKQLAIDVQSARDAMKTPMPDMPQYQAVDQPKPDMGSALGAALAGIFAPKSAMGAINGLEVTQKRQQDEYNQAVAANKEKYTADRDTYTAKADAREKNIDNRRALSTLSDTLVKNEQTNLTRIDNNLVNATLRNDDEKSRAHDRLVREHQAEQRLTLAVRNSNRMDRMFTYKQQHDAEVLGLRKYGIDTGLASRAADRSNRLSIAGLNSETSVSIANMKSTAEFIIEHAKELNNDHRDLVQGAFAFTRNTQTAFANLAGRDPASARRFAEGLAAYTNGAQGQGFARLLQANGMGGQAVLSQLEQVSSQMSNAGAPTDADGNALGAVPTAQLSDPNAKPTYYDNAALPQVDPSMPVPQAVSAFHQQHPSEFNSGGGGGNGGGPTPHAQQNLPPGIDPGNAPRIQARFSEALQATGGDKASAWEAIKSKFKGASPAELSGYRRWLFGQGGGSGGGKKQAPAAASAGKAPGDFGPIYQAAGKQYGIPMNIMFALARQESGGNANAVSPVGAEGVMQLMPGTAASLGVTNRRDPVQSIFGGARYLAQQYKHFGSWDKALAAYNAGPGAVEKYGGIPPYAETQNYVHSILGR